MNATLKAPFPYFGGKSKVADKVWNYFGNVSNYVEPFFGSGAVFLGRPNPQGNETVNDANGYISNFWRAIAFDPEKTAHYADWPVNENDLHARHMWLVERKDQLRANLEGDPEWFDAKIAGWWCWGMCCWIGSGFCEGNGPWRIDESEGNRKLVHLGNNGQGVNRKLVHLGDNGRGVNRQRAPIADWFAALSERFERTRVCCGDWSRVCGDSVTITHGTTAVFLDPPYLHEADGKKRHSELYGEHDCGQVALDVREWAIERGKDPLYRIILCGYEGEHDMPNGWHVVHWKTSGGYGSQGNGNGKSNKHRERLWISPHCIQERTLF